MARRPPEPALQDRHVVVGELADVGETQAAAVDDAGMVQGIQEHISPPGRQAAHHTQVDLETGAVGDSLLLSHKTGELGLQLFVEVKRPVEKAASGATGPVFLDGLDGGLLETRIVGKAEIRVGSEHQHLFSVCHPDKGILARGNGTVIGINPLRPDLVREGISGAVVFQSYVFHLLFMVGIAEIDGGIPLLACAELIILARQDSIEDNAHQGSDGQAAEAGESD